MIGAVAERLRHRCGCGEHRIVPGSGLELAGVNHRTDVMCFRCDAFGRAVYLEPGERGRR